MTAEERATALVPAEWFGSNRERIAQIASAIRAAENDALERAAMAMGRPVVGYLSPDQRAACIRSLKTPEGGK
jgi:hypothetical protein